MVGYRYGEGISLFPVGEGHGKGAVVPSVEKCLILSLIIIVVSFVAFWVVFLLHFSYQFYT